MIDTLILVRAFMLWVIDLHRLSALADFALLGVRPGLLILNGLRLVGLWRLRRWGAYLFVTTYVAGLLMFVEAYIGSLIPSWTGWFWMLYGLLWFWAIRRKWRLFT